LRNILFIFTLLPTALFGQTATFSADTVKDIRTNMFYDRMIEAEWKIKGQALHYGSKPIAVKTDNIIDTILFREDKNSKWDTLICNIVKPRNYKFWYNPCCGKFNVSDGTKESIIGAVIFNLNGLDKERQYLGTLGETGILLKATLNDTLKPGCRSAMSPNIYWLTLREIKICKDTIDCNEGTCLYEKGKEDLNYKFGYKTISVKLDCLFLPLSNQPIKVNYNLRTEKVKIE
jgi:hypothetical protein